MKKLIISTVAALCLGVVSIPASAASQSDIQAVQSKAVSQGSANQQLARYYRYYTPGYGYGAGYRGCGYRGCGYRGCGSFRSCGFGCGVRCCNPCHKVCYDRVVYRGGVYRGGVVRGHWRHHHRHHMMHHRLHHRR